MFEVGIDPKSFDLIKHLKKTHSFDNEQKCEKNSMPLKFPSMTNTKSSSVILDVNVPSNTSENEARGISKKIH